MSQISRDILSDITVHMKYAKYIPELNRRETWGELVTRNLEMHVKKYINKTKMPVTLYKPQNQKECDKVIELIKSKQ